MAGGMYEVIELESQAGVEPEIELLSEFELLARFAPALKTSNPSHGTLIQEWLEAFTTMEALQTAAGVKLEKKDSKEIFEDQLSSYAEAKTALKKATSNLADALVSLLADVSEAEIDEGKIHQAGTRKLGIVEFYTSKITPTPVQGILDKHGDHLPAHVVKELRQIKENNRKETKQKFSPKDTDS